MNKEMKIKPKRSFLEWYIILNQIILVILAAYEGMAQVGWTIDANIWNGFNSYVLPVLNILGFPILSLTQYFTPQLSEFRGRFLVYAIQWGYIILAFVISELLRRFVVKSTQKQLYSKGAFSLYEYILFAVTGGLVFAIICTTVESHFVWTMIVNGNTSPLSSPLDYMSVLINELPLVQTLFVVCLWVVRSMYKKALELKEDNDLVV